MNRLLEKFLVSRGYVCSQTKTVREAIEIKSYEDAIWDQHLQPIFPLDIFIATDLFAHRMIPGGNVYVDTLLKDKVGYEASLLKQYYDDFQPQSVSDVFRDGSVVTHTSKSQGLFSYLLPWDIKPKENGGKPLAYSGPMSEARGTKELHRLYEVKESIQKKGYLPEPSANLFHSNQVQGYFLRRGKEYRFVVLHGKHRVAAMAALGKASIPATFDLLHPRVIDNADIENWPQVANGIYEKKFAEMIFNTFFVQETS